MNTLRRIRFIIGIEIYTFQVNWRFIVWPAFKERLRNLLE